MQQVVQSRRAHARALLVLGLPLVGSHLAQMLLHVTDTIMLGWYGVEELAAVVLGASVFFITFIFGAGFAQAVMPMVAQALGRGDPLQARRATRMGIWLSVGFGALTYPLFWFSGPVLLALGQAPEIAELAQQYLRIAGIGMIPALLVWVLKSHLAAMERTSFVLAVTLVGVAVNALVNYALIFGNWGAPELGVRGAAIASVLVQALTALALGLYAHLGRGLHDLHLFARFWRPDWSAMGQVFRLGLPIGLTSLAEGGLFQAATLMMGWIGTIPLAAHGIVLQITAVAFMVHVGLSNAATVRVGHAAGRKAAADVRRVAKIALALSLGFGTTMVALFLLAPGPLIALFLDASDPSAPQIIALGTVLLALSALFQMVDATQVMALGFLRGLQDTRVPMWLATISYWLIGIPVSYVLAFPLGLGGAGLWLGLTVGLTVAAVLLLARFWRSAPRVSPPTPR